MLPRLKEFSAERQHFGLDEISTFGELQLNLLLLVHLGQKPLVYQEFLEDFGPSSGAILEEKSYGSETLIERFKSDSAYPIRISGTRGIYMFQ